MIYRNFEPDYRDVEEYKVPHLEKTYLRATAQASRIFEQRQRDMGLSKVLINLPGGRTGVIWRR